MSVIVALTIPASDFALGATLAADPEVRVTLERVVPVGDSFVPYLWVSDDHLDAVAAALRGDPDIASFDIVDAVDSEALVRVEWGEGLDGLLEAIAGNDGVILEAVGESDRWHLQLRFPDRDRLTTFYRRCTDDGINVDIENVYNPGVPRTVDSSVDLTDPQRETLQLAFEQGYFEVPRRISIVELAEELGISDSAVSQRLRRGIAELLLATLQHDGEPSRRV